MPRPSANKASQKQFPSDVDRNDVEIAERTVDTDKATLTEFKKVFVVGLDADAIFDHEANQAVVLQEAINLGLHPRGDVSFDGSEDNEVPGNTNLTYSVDVIPAHVDDEPEKTKTTADEISGK